MIKEIPAIGPLKDIRTYFCSDEGVVMRIDNQDIIRNDITKKLREQYPLISKINSKAGLNAMKGTLRQYMKSLLKRLDDLYIEDLSVGYSRLRDAAPSVQLITEKGAPKRCYIADIVLITFQGYLGDAYKAWNKNNNRHDNRNDNLQWVLRKNMHISNILDAYEDELYRIKMNSMHEFKDRHELSESVLAEFISRSAELADPLKRKHFFELKFKV